MLLVAWMSYSCVPNKKFVYLQKEDVNKKDLPKDSVVRSYNLQIRDYTIQPLDILSVNVESLTNEEFDFMNRLIPAGQGQGLGQNGLLLSGFVVDQAGEIEFPIIGKIKFSGLNIFEAQEKLQGVLKSYLKNPVARIRLLNFRITVLGEVNRESQVNSQNTRVTLMEVIGLAGGLTDLADRANVKVIRQHGDKAEVFYMNLLDEDLLTMDNYYVQQNDIIVVPSLKQRPFRRYLGQNLALFVSTISVILLTVNLLN
ncbi:MAG: polysaccharide biosynthesis/export family protein [Cyclobacteriaceae bacterium]